MTRREFGFMPALAMQGAGEEAVRTGRRRELFADRELVASFRGVTFQPGTVSDGGIALRLERPWEGAFSAYTTVIHDDGLYRLYYRGLPQAGRDGNAYEVTCYAESRDGREFSRPDLGLYQIAGSGKNNVILAGEAPFSHNFAPMLDRKPGVKEAERYKALAGLNKTGLMGFVSADGIRWRKLREEPVFPSPGPMSLDSQNQAFWSEAEQRYVLYFRTWKRIGGQNYRWISRATSEDFLHWSEPEEMSFGDAPPEHLYTNQTSPYFRAPHLYVGICARFLPGRQVVDEKQAGALGVNPDYYKDCSDAVLITSRGGIRYSRQFLEAFLRPGVGLENWVSRSNYPALNIVPAGPATMSFYVNRNYGQPTAHLRRYELRLDGLAPARAGYGGGELTTKPIVFEGSRLELNFSTSAPGSIRVEMQDASGNPLPGYTLGEARELVGDEIARTYVWTGGESVMGLSGKPIRVRFVMKDADLFSYRFVTPAQA